MVAGNKLIISGIYYPGGGLSSVMTLLAHHLGNYFEIVCLGFVHAGLSLSEDPVPGCRFIRAPIRGNTFMVYDQELLRNLIEAEQFDNVLLLGPVHLNRSFIRQLKPFNIRLIAYVPYEGKIKNDYDLADLAQLDHCAFYTRYVYECYTEMLEAGGHDPAVAKRSGFVGHGTACNTFYPLHADRTSKKEMARKQLYPGKEFTEDAFIVLNINRPYFRKRLDISLAAFKIFATGKQNVFMHFHLGPTNQQEVDTFRGEIDKLELGEQVFLTYSLNQQIIFPDEWVNLLYNACDVGITTSMGEGWGMGLFEHAATRVPVVAPAHTGFIENWEGTGILIPTCGTQYIFYENTDMFIVSADEAANALSLLYTDPELYERIAEQCYRHATSAAFKWENTAAYFAKIITAGFPCVEANV